MRLSAGNSSSLLTLRNIKKLEKTKFRLLFPRSLGAQAEEKGSRFSIPSTKKELEENTKTVTSAGKLLIIL